jgi:glutathione synthase
MQLSIGILMDDITTLKTWKDSTFAMMLAAQARGHRIYYFQQGDLFVEEGEAQVTAQQVTVIDQKKDYATLGEKETFPLSDFNTILMRKDPPFDMEYIYSTYILEMAERKGTLVVNPPESLRRVNEKFFISYFPELTPKTLITRDMSRIRAFIDAEERAVVKPMDGMGGMGIFKMEKGGSNTGAILESLGNGSRTLMVQGFLPKVTQGDKRILLVDGEAPAHGLARIPQGDEFRANLAAGGKGVTQPLTQREKEICAKVKPMIQQLGLLLVGLDVIDGHITEINVTSPTCMREIAADSGEDIAARLIEAVERKVAAR